MIVAPRFVVLLLLGEDVAGVAVAVARCFGIALLAVGLACWPGAAGERGASPAFRGMLVYNVLIALFLAYLFTVRRTGGMLLWPAVVLHATVAMLMVLGWRTGR